MNPYASILSSLRQPGRFDGELRLTWLGPRSYRFDPTAGFRFTRASGEIITPGLMLTDLGSIPRPFWFIKDLDPWSYAYAFVLHDWGYEQHWIDVRNNQSGRSFDDNNRLCCEAIWTMMVAGIVPVSVAKLWAVYIGISNPWTRRDYWDKIPLQLQGSKN